MKPLQLLLVILCFASCLLGQDVINPARVKRLDTNTVYDRNWNDTHFIRGWNWGWRGKGLDSALDMNYIHFSVPFSIFTKVSYSAPNSFRLNQRRALYVDAKGFNNGVALNGVNSNNPSDATFNAMALYYEPTLTVDPSQEFKPRASDQTGAVFGWRNHNALFINSDSTSPNYQRIALNRDSISGSAREVLSGAWLSNGLYFQNFGLPYNATDYELYKPQYDYLNGRKWFCAINLRSLDSITSSNMDSVVLEIKLPARTCHLRSAFCAVSGTDTTWTRTYTQRPLGFASFCSDSMYDFRRVVGKRGDDRGIVRDELDSNRHLPVDTVWRITGKMLRADSTGAPNKDVTLFAYLYLGDTLRYNALPKPMGDGYTGFTGSQKDLNIYDFIDSVDITVSYRGVVNCAIDWIRLETPQTKRMYEGAFDSLVYKLVDTLEHYTAGNPLNYRVHRIYTDDETMAPHWCAERYFNMLVDTLAAFETFASALHPLGGVSPGHFLHATGYKEFWNGSNLTYFGKDVGGVAPNVRIGRDGNVSNLGYKRGYAGTFGYSFGSEDTLHSGYELYLDGTANTLPISPISKYNWIWDPYTCVHFNASSSRQYIIERDIVQTYYNRHSMLYSGMPWWANLWFDNNWTTDALHHTFQAAGTYPFTGEQANMQMGLPILLGAKGYLFYCKTKLASLPSTMYMGAQPDETDMYAGVGQDYARNEGLGGDWINVSDSTKFRWKQYFHSSVYNWAEMGIDSNHIYLGLTSTRLEILKRNRWIAKNEAELMRLRLCGWFGKGFSRLYTQTNDTSVTFGFDTLLSRFVDISRITTRPIDRTQLGAPYYEQHSTVDSGFYDVTLLRHADSTTDAVFYVGVLNRRTDPLWRDSTYRLGQMNFIPVSEFDTLKHCIAPRRSWLDPSLHDSTWWMSKYWSKLGCREISVPFTYVPMSANQQSRLLHIEEMVLDSSNKHIDTVICANCALATNYQPGESKLFRVTVMMPKDANVASGSLDFCNQRKIVASPVRDSSGSIDSNRVRYHVVYHRIDTIVSPMYGVRAVPRVYYKRSKVIDRCTPQDVNPLDPNVAGLWEVTRCISDTIREYSMNCRLDSMLINEPCKYPSIVVRYDSTDQEEYVYVVFNCQNDHPTHALHSVIAEAQFVAQGSVGSSAARVIERFGKLGDDDIDLYGHASVNASKYRNYYAWSSAVDGIRIATRSTTLDSLVRCPSGGEWSFRSVSWNTPKGAGDFGADCRHPSLNTYSRLANEDSCALVWEERRVHNDTTRPFDDWHIYYTHLSMRGGILTCSLPPYKGGDPAVLDTNSLGTITRISKWITNRRGFSEHHLPSVARNMTVLEPTWRADVISWAGEGTNTFVCGPTPSNAHAVFLLPMWSDRDTLFYVGNHSIWSCALNLRNPSLTWSTSFTQDSDVVFDFSCPPDGFFYGTDMIFNFGKRYWSFTAPMNIIAGGNSPHLSAQPIIGTNTQWKQIRRLFNSPSSSVNPPILSSVKGLFKAAVRESPYTAYPLVGFENADGVFTICDLLDDGRTSTMRALFPQEDEKRYAPSDTVYSDWFVVNDKRALHFVINGEYTTVAMMFLQNKRTSLLTYVDLDQIVIDSTHDVHIGRFDVLNGGGDEYKILLTKRDSSAKYVENVYIDNRLPYYGKMPSSTLTDQSYEVDLGISSGLTMNSPLLAYPNPAEESLFIGVAHQNKSNEASGNILQVIITNIDGEVVKRIDTRGGETLRVSTAEMSPGVYNIYLMDHSSLVGSKKRSSMKVVVSR